ncbi:hypothetical protein RB2083_1486 [Rhodobacteraceae bacterium HTCC2083]|nr:hypothetical protein RB2083_1486 [Rhodobacteraceae bacterium HTCC2083]
MNRLMFGLTVVAFVASCGADGMPTKPTKPLKERLEERAAAAQKNAEQEQNN